MIEQTLTVIGMACGHCESFVTEELNQLDGVISVSVDIAEEAVTVTSQHPLDPTEVARALDRAGYEVASPEPSGVDGPM